MSRRSDDEPPRLPAARQDGLLVRELFGEMILYDLRTHKAHCLNRAASVVWRRCHAGASVAETAEEVGRELGMPADQRLVRLALERLEQAGLLEAHQPAGFALSRRELARRLGVAGGLALLLPLVTSLDAPLAAQSVSCLPNEPGCRLNGVPCGSSTSCCSCCCNANSNVCTGAGQGQLCR